MTNIGGETTISQTTVWLTPPYLLESLGEFDLDPCASTNRPWDTAKKHYTIEDDGLSKHWEGRVWLNPPYGSGMDKWLSRLSNHPEGGLSLIFARTETKTFFDYVWGKASGILFIKGRIKFHKPDGSLGGTAGSPSVLVSYGEREKDFLSTLPVAGKFLEIN